MNNHRYEIKFILDQSSLVQARRWMMQYSSAKRTHPTRSINTIYFDDPNFTSVSDNLSGISNRKKYRLRWYHFEDRSNIQLLNFEVKYREDRVGKKNRFLMKNLRDSILDTKFIDLFDKSLAELNSNGIFLDNTSFLSPSLQVNYLREYFEGLEGIRVTIDQNIKFFNPFSYSTPFQMNPISIPQVIMEVKFSPEQKDLVSNSLRSFHLIPKRHSKYLVGLASLGLAVYI